MIRFYQTGDDEKIVELLQRTFPKWATFNDPLDLWRWKYINTPLKSLIIIAEMDHRIIACNHTVIYNAKLGSEITKLGYDDDLAIDPNFRGQGLWTKIRDKKNEKLVKLVKYIHTSTTNPIVLQSWIRRNRLLLPFPVTRMLKTDNINDLLKERQTNNKILFSLGYIFFNYINKITNLIRKPKKQLPLIKITQVSNFDENINKFWLQIKDDYNYILEKKKGYLNWRFTNNDRGSHVIFQAKDESGILGYVVIGFRQGSTEGFIEDLIALKDRVDIVDALFSVACNYFEDKGINSLYYQVVRGHPYRKISEWHGFIDTRSRPTIMFDYSINWRGDAQKNIPFLENTSPAQVDFTYATTI